MPFPPESPASGIGETGFHPVVWYRRTVYASARRRRRAPAAALRRRRLPRARVGQRPPRRHARGRAHAVQRRHHGARCGPSGEQVVVIRAEDTPHDLAQPRGKQDWQEEPHKIWYHRTTGIWQPVWLEPVAATHITVAALDPRPRPRPAGPRAGAAAARRRRRAAARARAAEPARYAAGRRYLHHARRRCLQREIALDAGATDHGALSSCCGRPSTPTCSTRRSPCGTATACVDEVQSYAGLRSVGVGQRALPAQPPPLLSAPGAGAGLLARVAPGRAERRRAAPRGRTGQRARLQRRPHPPEGRRPALPVLVRPPRPDGVGRDGQRLRLLRAGASSG